MSYFPDWSAYSYCPGHARPDTYNVGWLDSGYEFPRGKVPSCFVERLRIYCQCPVLKMRGFHVCNLCKRPRESTRIPIYDGIVGNGEIRVFGVSGTVFAAPVLILHYILAHRYLPPSEFVNAVISQPPPGSEEYLKRLKAYDLSLDPPVPCPTKAGGCAPTGRCLDIVRRFLVLCLTLGKHKEN